MKEIIGASLQSFCYRNYRFHLVSCFIQNLIGNCICGKETKNEKKIRYETENRITLDDVMRTLYEKYHKEQNRGFLDAEFCQECESAAGCPLPEIFDIYASTVQDIDYAKYLAYAGLEIDVNYGEQPGIFFGVETGAEL
ncbi:hypothetical protein ACFLRW_04680 [Acidobacteriota bacterium]